MALRILGSQGRPCMHMWLFLAGQSSRGPLGAANMPLDWPVLGEMWPFEVWKYFVTFNNLGEELVHRLLGVQEKL